MQLKLKRLQSKSTSNITIQREIIIKEELEKLPTKVSNFINMQLRHGPLKKNKVWTTNERKIALGLRYRSPALYEQMRSDGFALPSRSTITRWLEQIHLQPGICPELLDQIKERVNAMAQHEKQVNHIY